MNLIAEDYKTIIFDGVEQVHFPIDIQVEDTQIGGLDTKLVTAAWLDDDGYLRFKSEEIGKVIFIKKLSGGIVG